MKKTAAAILAAGFAAASILPAAACASKGQEQSLEGTYVLAAAVFEGIDCTDDFQTYTATFSENGTLRVIIGYLSSIETRNSTYTFDGTTVTESYANKTYTYVMEGENMRTEYDGMSILLTREQEEEDDGGIDFRTQFHSDSPP